VITLDDIKRLCPQTRTVKLAEAVGPLNDAMAEFEINNVARETAFLAQLAHESMGFQLTRELWGPTKAQEGYEGRADLGNTEPGDGHRYMGRGYIQITGRANYTRCGEALGLDLIGQPELLEIPANAARSAGWFWQTNHLNARADLGDFRGITKKINGGTTGWADRLAYYERAQQVLA